MYTIQYCTSPIFNFLVQGWSMKLWFWCTVEGTLVESNKRLYWSLSRCYCANKARSVLLLGAKNMQYLEDGLKLYPFNIYIPAEEGGASLAFPTWLLPTCHRGCLWRDGGRRQSLYMKSKKWSDFGGRYIPTNLYSVDWRPEKVQVGFYR